MQDQLRSEQEQVPDSRIEPTAKANNETSRQRAQKNQGRSQRLRTRVMNTEERSCASAQKCRNGMKSGALQVGIQRMNSEHLVHDKAEVPKDQQDLHKRRDVQHDRERHHQNV